MPLNKPLDAITEADLQELITDHVAEQKTTDYKKGLHLDAEPPKDEFRRDVSSFANAIGGNLIIGMDEDGGLPTDLCGIDIPNQERFSQRIDELLQNKITPRIPGVAHRIIPLTNGKLAVVIRIPESFIKPHQVQVGKDDFQFWARNSTGKSRLVVDELRSIFLQSGTLAERIRAFRTERLSMVMSEDTPVPLMDGPKVIYHIIPASAFSAQARYNFGPLQGLPWAEGIRKFGDSSRYNLDGIVYHNLGHYIQPGAKSYLYAQVFRNGVIEAVDAYGMSGGATKINGFVYDARIVDHLKGLLANCKQLGVEPPLFVMVSLIGVRGFTISTDMTGLIQEADYRPIQRDTLLLPDVQIDDYATPIPTALRPVLNALWNAAGWERSQSYDASGEWKDEA